MKPRSSLDCRLLAVITVAFSALCASAMWTDLGSVPDAHQVTAPT
jgi:hypothetical protein